MLDFLDQFDKSVFLYLNDLNASWMDYVMIFVSGKLSWLPLYIFIIIAVIYKFKKKAWLALVLVFVTFAATDVISTQVFKKGLKRLRPCHNTEINHTIHQPDGCGGKYGFFSSHASNTFGLAMLCWCLFNRKKKYWRWMFLWAGVVSYSRIYLGKHYPLDIICGAIFGCLVAYSLFQVVKNRLTIN